MSDSFNVLTATYEPMRTGTFAGMNVEGRILQQSADGRHLTIATRYPDGIVGGFFYGADVTYYETFYIVAGTGRRTFRDGRVEEMVAGDAIFVQPGIDVEYVYDPGFVDIAFFWSDRPLPDSLAGGLSAPATG